MKPNDFAILADALRHEAQAGVTDETKRVRAFHGVYSLRGQPGRYVVRVRVPAGILTPDQLETLAALAEEAGGPDGAHLTTRQGIEIAGVPAADVPGFLRRVEAADLTTLRTGGPVVRGVVCCPLAGVAPDELLDVTPYAVATDRHFREHPDLQQLPRKIKIAFEGCLQDHVRTAVADIGVRVVRRGGELGFRIVAGGGLGASPKTARAIEEFTPVNLLSVTIEAILRVFDRHGARQNRTRARLKWLVGDWGLSRFHDAIVAERTRLLSEDPRRPIELPSINEARQSVTAPTWTAATGPGQTDTFAAWRQSNVRPQKQPGYVTVFLRCPLGDLQPNQLRRVAAAARIYAGSVRASIEQNLVLRWVPEATLPSLHAFLEAQGLALPGAEQLLDITRCVGATTCLSAITNPKSAARAIAAALEGDLARDPALQGLRVRVSGCLNSCGHHHAADVGLFGVAKHHHGRPVPHYLMLLGGAVTGESFGSRLIAIPASRVASAVEQVLRHYRAERRPNESFAAFVTRLGLPRLREDFEPLARLAPAAIAPELYRDLDAAAEFTTDSGDGECAASGPPAL